MITRLLAFIALCLALGVAAQTALGWKGTCVAIVAFLAGGFGAAIFAEAPHERR